MASLDHYLSSQRGRQAALAKRLGLGAGTLSGIRSGFRRPSTELAKKIEVATNGEVRATELLGLKETGAHFEHLATPHPLNKGRWAVNVASNGSAALSAEMLRDLGINPGDQLHFEKSGDSIVVTSSSDALARARRMFAQRVPADLDVVTDFIADRRAEAARE